MPLPRRQASIRGVEYETLSARTVADAMHAGVITCPPETPLREVARMMARFRVHAIVVLGEDDGDEAGGIWGVVSDSDVVTAIDRGDVDSVTAGGTARTPVVTIRPEETLRRAAHLMRSQGVTHVVVVSSGAGKALGILSTLDLVRAVALEPVPGP
jgi:CBS domain-containing protein